MKREINIGDIEIYLNWCERTENEVTSESYQEFLDQESIEKIFKDN